jgi:NAD(P)-dependent dehydrogenase (short-subunit alcohol dehydrogenase family)
MTTSPTSRHRNRTTINELPDNTTVIVGASRGLGRGIASAFAQAGTPVVAVARTADALSELAGTSPNIRTEVADATDATVAGSLFDRYRPRTVVLVAGATPTIAPLQEQTWETFSVNWHTDVRIAFHWLREAVLQPPRPGSRVVVISSGAAVAGSPLSGGYAGAKATQRFITAYAQDEANRADLGISFTAVLPRITPLTDLGRPTVQAYATRSGRTEEEYARQFGEPLTPQAAGAAVVELVETDAATLEPAYLLTSAGLQPLPRPPSSVPPRPRAEALSGDVENAPPAPTVG